MAETTYCYGNWLGLESRYTDQKDYEIKSFL